MRNSNLLKWAQNSKQNDKGNRNWIHPPDALQKGHIAYLVKFLGNTEVEQPKGIEVVKEGIRKLKFNQQLRKSEGTKTPKVELTISIDGVAIQEPKTKKIIHQYPLHRISYCADDKGEKKFFSFIAKDCPESERHMCFVFVSDKLAEEITLTIGQAFDLAYKRFLETSGKDLEVQRRLLLLQQRVKTLEHENTSLKQRLSDVLNGQANDLEGYMRRNNIKDMLVVEGADRNSSDSASSSPVNGTETNGLLLNLSSSPSSGSNAGSPPLPPVPPRAFEKHTKLSGDEAPAVGRKLEGLLLEELDSEEEFDPRGSERNKGVLPPLGILPPLGVLPPPPRPKQQDLDPFGMDHFAPLPERRPAQIESALGLLDKRILEMKDGFSRGLSFGNDDFSIESLDPLRK